MEIRARTPCDHNLGWIFEFSPKEIHDLVLSKLLAGHHRFTGSYEPSAAEVKVKLMVHRVTRHGKPSYSSPHGPWSPASRGQRYRPSSFKRLPIPGLDSRHHAAGAVYPDAPSRPLPMRSQLTYFTPSLRRDRRNSGGVGKLSAPPNSANNVISLQACK